MVGLPSWMLWGFYLAGKPTNMIFMRRDILYGRFSEQPVPVASGNRCGIALSQSEPNSQLGPIRQDDALFWRKVFVLDDNQQRHACLFSFILSHSFFVAHTPACIDTYTQWWWFSHGLLRTGVFFYDPSGRLSEQFNQRINKLFAWSVFLMACLSTTAHWHRQ